MKASYAVSFEFLVSLDVEGPIGRKRGSQKFQFQAKKKFDMTNSKKKSYRQVPVQHACFSPMKNRAQKIKKQETHGPHRSLEKTVQINKHI